MGCRFTGKYLLASSSAVGAAPVTYPILLGGWFKTLNNLQIHTGVSVTNNSSGANTGLLECCIRGDTGTDEVQLAVGGSGGANAAAGGSTTALVNTWFWAGGYFSDDANRYPVLGTSVGSLNFTSRVPTGLSHTGLGTRYTSSTANFLAGDFWLAEQFIAVGYSAGNITTILSQLQTKRPTDIAELSPYLVFYQPLRTAANDSGAVFTPSWTDTGVTFDANEHPVAYPATAPTTGIGMHGDIYDSMWLYS